MLEMHVMCYYQQMQLSNKADKFMTDQMFYLSWS